MVPSPNDVEKLYNKELNVCIKENATSLYRKSPLHIDVQQSTITSPLVRRELQVRLTDETDPFFLYTLTITEEDFQNLKSQQGLLVDYVAFPQKFLDLLELCLTEQSKEIPRFVLSFITNGRLGTDPGMLEIVETNPFKHLVHLSLNMIPATDNQLKKYLAQCLKVVKEERDQLENHLKSQGIELQAKIKNLSQQLSEQTSTLDKLQAEYEQKISSLESQNEIELESIRTQKNMEIELEKNRSSQQLIETEHRLNYRCQQLETRISCLDTLNRELQEKNTHLDTVAQELRKRLREVEEELESIGRQRAQQLMDAKLREERIHELSQNLSQAQSHIDSLKIQLAETEDKLSWERQGAQRLRDEVTHLEEQVKEKKAALKQREAETKKLAQELFNGNDLLRRLQDELRSSHSQMKLRDKLALKQESVLSEKEEKINKLSQEKSELLEKLKAQDKELEELRKLHSELLKDKEEFIKRQRSNETVIRWLNTQLQEQKFLLEQATLSASQTPGPSGIPQMRYHTPPLATPRPTPAPRYVVPHLSTLTPPNDNNLGCLLQNNGRPHTPQMEPPLIHSSSSSNSNTVHRSGSADQPLST